MVEKIKMIMKQLRAWVQSQGTRADVTTDTTDKGRNGEITTTAKDQVDGYETVTRILQTLMILLTTTNWLFSDSIQQTCSAGL